KRSRWTGQPAGPCSPGRPGRWCCSPWPPPSSARGWSTSSPSPAGPSPCTRASSARSGAGSPPRERQARRPSGVGRPAMTSLDLVTRGAALGFSVAAPVGPIGLLCIQRTLNRGRLHGLAVGLGAATADALYGLVAGLGLAWVSSAASASGPWLRLAGAAFLI